jgi:hypothetical protein
MLSKKQMDIQFDIFGHKLHEVNNQIKALEEQKEIIIKDLRLLIDNNSYTTANFVYIKEFRKAAIDYKALAEVFDVEQFRKKEQVLYWIFKKNHSE